MKLLVGTLFAVLAVAVQAKKSKGSGRIVGGNEAFRNQFPYQVGLVLKVDKMDNPRLCGGSLISSTRVLTAAHCLIIVSLAHVVLGAHMLFEYEPSQVKINIPASEFIIHPEYSNEKNLNDIAMIKLPSAVAFNDAVSPIELAEGTNDFAGVSGVISGWGFFDYKLQPSPKLRFASMKVITNLACFAVFADYIFDSTICSQGEGNDGGCFGDSGGPLAVQKNGKSLLVGVTSFTAESGCERGLPNGFARVTSFIPWIKSNM